MKCVENVDEKVTPTNVPGAGCVKLGAVAMGVVASANVAPLSEHGSTGDECRVCPAKTDTPFQVPTVGQALKLVPFVFG